MQQMSPGNIVLSFALHHGSGKHFFEFWRDDAARPADFGESSFQTIYRTAQVSIRPVRADAGTYQAQVEVLVQRSDRPMPQVTSTSEAYSLFSSASDARRRRNLLLERESARRKDYLADLGNDRGLEAKLTAEIAAAADKLRGGSPPAKAQATSFPATAPRVRPP